MDTDEFDDLQRLALTVARRAGARDPELVRDEVLQRLVLAPEPVENRRAWVRTVAGRVAIDEHRAAERRGGSAYAFDEGVDLHGPTWVPSPSAEVRRRLFAQDLLDSLSPRDANLLRDWADGWTAAEMAQRYGLTVGALQVQLTRLKTRLRAVAERDGADLE